MMLPHSGQHFAIPKGRLNGRRVYRVPVQVALNDSRRCESRFLPVVYVTAYGAKDAADWMLAQCRERPETEVHAWGPKGGHVQRFNSWESCIGHALLDTPRGPVIHRQNNLELDTEVTS